MCTLPNATVESAITEELLALEHRVNDGWLKGEPDENLAILADDMTYFDSAQGKRIDGIENMRPYFESFRGKLFMDGYQMVDGATQTRGPVSVLTYRMLLRKAGDIIPYNCTQVYARDEPGWRLIHSHFSRAKQS